MHKLFYLENQLETFMEEYTKELVTDFHYGNNNFSHTWLGIPFAM